MVFTTCYVMQRGAKAGHTVGIDVGDLKAYSCSYFETEEGGFMGKCMVGVTRFLLLCTVVLLLPARASSGKEIL
jgi:hypothetical protein